ncbi:hypothetical protein TKK_0006635 [Trichogramma kaykai]|uniref:HTH CENPB-type domain-containing protein n=1 Tax=Trichogramma kaykai TaxID=54128 RepID=A0ABD2XDM2_9HYME
MERQRRRADYVELDGKKAIIEFKRHKDNKLWSDEKIAVTFEIRTEKVQKIWENRRQVEKDTAARLKSKAEQKERRAEAYENIEKKLLKWHKTNKNKKTLKITGQLLIDTATKYAKKANLDIRFNYVWLNSFKKTHGITIEKSRGRPCSSASRGVAHENNSDKENQQSNKESAESSQTNLGSGTKDDSLPNNHESDDGEDGASKMNPRSGSKDDSLPNNHESDDGEDGARARRRKTESNAEDDSSQNYYDKKAEYARVRKSLKKFRIPTKTVATKAVVTLCHYAEQICEQEDYNEYVDALEKIERIVRKTI